MAQNTIPFQLTVEQIYRLLREVDGNVSEAHRVLRQHRIKISYEKLSGIIKGDQRLSNLVATLKDNDVVERSEPLDEVEALQRGPSLFQAKDSIIAELSQSVEEEFARGGLAKLGYKPNEIEEMIGFQQYADRSFLASLDQTHGHLATIAYRVGKRLEEIRVNILEGDDEKYSFKEKMAAQREYTKLLAEFRKIHETFHGAAKLRLEALQHVLKPGDPGKTASSGKDKLDDAIPIKGKRLASSRSEMRKKG